MTKFNILHLAQSVGPNSAGMGAVALGLAEEQRALGYGAKIWTFDQKTENKLDVQSILRFPYFGPTAIGYSPEMEKAAKKNIGNNYEILHQHGIWMANSRVASRWRKTWCRPTILAPHGMLEESALKISRFKKLIAAIAYEAKNLHETNCLHATSLSEARSFRQYGLKQLIALIPIGVSERWIMSQADGERFRRAFGITRERRILLYLSRLHPLKGLSMLFSAIAMLRSELGDWLLVVAGSGQPEYLKEMNESVKQLGISKWVQFVGPLYGLVKRDAFGAAEVFVLPTHSEAFGIAIAEALGAGLPVLTTRGAPWEILLRERCGWWVDIHSDAIMDGLAEAISISAAELRAMGERGRKLVISQFTWRIVAEKTISLYRYLLGQGNRPDYVISE